MKIAIKLGAISAANIATVFLFQLYVLVELGPGLETDALFAGMAIPQLVLAIISGSLMHVLVPLLAGETEDRLRHDAWGYLTLIGGLFGLIAILLFLAATWWVPLTVPGFNEDGKILTIELARIQLIGMFFAAVNSVQWAAYHARHQFLWAEFTPFISSVIALLLLIWALPRFGVMAAAWIGLTRMVMQTILLAPGMGTPARPNLKSAAIQQGWLRIKPLLLGTAYYKTDPLVDRFLLSTTTSGSLSLYYFAQQIYGAVSQVVNKSITAPLVPKLSMLHKAGDKTKFSRTYRRKLLQVGIICLSGLLILGLLGQTLIGFLVGHGNVNEGNVNKLWWVMIWLGGMFLGGTAGQITSTAFYACGDTVTPTRISMTSYTVYIPGKIIAFYFWDIVGLAIATSAYYIINLALQFFILRRMLKI